MIWGVVSVWVNDNVFVLFCSNWIVLEFACDCNMNNYMSTCRIGLGLWRQKVLIFIDFKRLLPEMGVVCAFYI